MDSKAEVKKLLDDSNGEGERRKLGASFGSVANDYADSRPTYSDMEFLDELFTEKDVLELGAGTGLFSRIIKRRPTSTFIASDLSLKMLEANSELPSSHKVSAVAEALPFPSSTFDTVAVAQAAHWFDLIKAPNEIRRIIKDRGTLLIIWNHRDSSHDWVREFDRVVDSYQNRIITEEILKGFEASTLFTKFRRHSKELIHSITEKQAVQLINSFSPVSTLPDSERFKVIEEAMAVLRRAHRERAIFDIPYTTNYFTANVK